MIVDTPVHFSAWHFSAWQPVDLSTPTPEESPMTPDLRAPSSDEETQEARNIASAWENPGPPQTQVDECGVQLSSASAFVSSTDEEHREAKRLALAWAEAEAA